MMSIEVDELIEKCRHFWSIEKGVNVEKEVEGLTNDGKCMEGHCVRRLLRVSDQNENQIYREGNKIDPYSK